MKPYLFLSLLFVGCTTPVKGPTAPVASLPPAVHVMAAPAAVASNPDELVLSKETLGAQKVVVPNGGVTLRKVITSSPATVTVDVNTESYEIVRTGPSGQSPDFSGKEIGLTLTKEQAQAVVSAQVVEVVKLNKLTTSAPVNVSGSVRSEDVVTVKNP